MKKLKYKRELEKQLREQKDVRNFEKMMFLSSISPNGKVQWIQPKTGVGSNFIW